MDRPDIDAIIDRAERAERAIHSLAANGDKAFRMRVPVNVDDTDMILLGPVDDVRALVAYCCELERRHQSPDRNGHREE